MLDCSTATVDGQGILWCFEPCVIDWQWSVLRCTGWSPRYHNSWYTHTHTCTHTQRVYLFFFYGNTCACEYYNNIPTGEREMVNAQTVAAARPPSGEYSCVTFMTCIESAFGTYSGHCSACTPMLPSEHYNVIIILHRSNIRVCVCVCLSVCDTVE